MSNNSRPNTSVITIRIDENLNQHLDQLKQRLGLSKADIIRNYLELSRYLVKQKSSIKSLNDRDLIIVKRSLLRNLCEEIEETEQIRLGDKLGRFINDIARIQGEIDNINYKLNLCEALGYFPKFIDNENFILLTKKFGPPKFAESFVLQMFKQKEFNPKYIESELRSSKSLQSQYEKDIGKPVERSSSHYSFEIAKIPEEE